jgi:hypothetical protein
VQQEPPRASRAAFLLVGLLKLRNVRKDSIFFLKDER